MATGRTWPVSAYIRRVRGVAAPLRTDYIDLYQMHHVDRDTPWDEIWQAMEVLVAQGKILYVGSSNFAGGTRALRRGGARGFFGLVSEQSIYNLMTREIELEVLPAAIDYGVGVIPWSPLNGGLLGGVLRKERNSEGARRASGRAADALAANRDKLAAYEDLCDELGEEPANVALAWLLHAEGVTAPIVGPRTHDQLDDARRAVSLELGGDVRKRLDAIFPGYKTAPEHYAW